MSFSINRRWVVFCEAASSHPPSVRTAMLVFTWCYVDSAAVPP
jgi:hypothetical protein